VSTLVWFPCEVSYESVCFWIFAGVHARRLNCNIPWCGHHVQNILLVLSVSDSTDEEPESSSSNKPNGPPEAIKVISNSQVQGWSILSHGRQSEVNLSGYYDKWNCIHAPLIQLIDLQILVKRCFYLMFIGGSSCFFHRLVIRL